jgi:antitoxin component of RelBE/YafQ-DinJ toxin-antitoxin module
MGEETPIRTIRISEELWKRAQDKAQRQETTVSEAVRRFLERWTKE